MIVPTLSRGEAKAYLSAQIDGREYRPTFDESACGMQGDWLEVRAKYRDTVQELVAEYGESDGRTAQLEMDARAAEKLHSALPLTDDASADDGFWRYIALEESWELIAWRHGRMDEGRTKVGVDHVGLGGTWECFPKRIWFRGELSIRREAADPYELTRRGGRDFWASGVVRHAYSSARPLVRALVKYQYPEAGGFTGMEYRPQTLTLNGVRELYKRLQHFQAFVALSTLTEREAMELIESLAENLPRVRG